MEVTYHRMTDYKEFSTEKLYIMLDDHSLVDFKDDGFTKFGGLSFNEIKKALDMQ